MKLSHFAFLSTLTLSGCGVTYDAWKQIPRPKKKEMIAVKCRFGGEGPTIPYRSVNDKKPKYDEKGKEIFYLPPPKNRVKGLAGNECRWHFIGFKMNPFPVPKMFQ